MMRLASLAIAAALLLPRTACAAALPDQPGAVTSASAREICAHGYASGIRPRGRAWRSLKRALYERYGLARGRRYGYVADHIVPLELGGAPADLRNLWLQPYNEAHAKDHVENDLHVLVCDGRMPLTAAQERIARDWTTAVPAGTRLTPAERSRLDHDGQSDY
jgi:hypothetical protein